MNAEICVANSQNTSGRKYHDAGVVTEGWGWGRRGATPLPDSPTFNAHPLSLYLHVTKIKMEKNKKLGEMSTSLGFFNYMFGGPLFLRR